MCHLRVQAFVCGRRLPPRRHTLYKTAMSRIDDLNEEGPIADDWNEEDPSADPIVTAPEARTAILSTTPLPKIAPELPKNYMVCSRCYCSQVVNPPVKSIQTVRFCLTCGPPLRCERWKSVENYYNTSADDFDAMCSDELN